MARKTKARPKELIDELMDAARDVIEVEKESEADKQRHPESSAHPILLERLAKAKAHHERVSARFSAVYGKKT
jgi:hypothetical protein